ncbi:MAG: KEOPS complex kinase/ATPase Bud32, partial [Candidatus Diapherotrites archaeon]|nr:KEOPS complex kinase/ATPase Bud32 [Candidatus Diapherotrites archaeon]
AKKRGIRVPLVRHVNLADSVLVLEYIDAPTAKIALSKKNAWICPALGKIIAALHAGDLIHGDLTTSNVLVKEKELVLIDFGLGFYSAKVEDKATDLLNLKKMFGATHPDVSDGWELIMDAYQNAYADGQRVVALIAEIESRTRYS